MLDNYMLSAKKEDYLNPWGYVKTYKFLQKQVILYSSYSQSPERPSNKIKRKKYK